MIRTQMNGRDWMILGSLALMIDPYTLEGVGLRVLPGCCLIHRSTIALYDLIAITLDIANKISLGYKDCMNKPVYFWPGYRALFGATPSEPSLTVLRYLHCGIVPMLEHSMQ